jgi:hypothetical protein
MKKVYVCFLIVSLSLAFAFDLEAIEDSEGTLGGALEGAFSALGVSTVFLPDYGINYSINDMRQEGTPQESATQIADLLKALSSTVSGLDEGNWISVTYNYFDFDVSYSLVVRMKPNQPETLEVFVDGVKQ